jgi:hypothetical protein
MLSPLTPEFIERFEAIVESDKPVANKFAESLILIFDERLKAESGGEPSRTQTVPATRRIGSRADPPATTRGAPPGSRGTRWGAFVCFVYSVEHTGLRGSGFEPASPTRFLGRRGTSLLYPAGPVRSGLGKR